MAKNFSPKNIVLRDLIILRDRLDSYQASKMEAGFLSGVIQMISKDLTDK